MDNQNANNQNEKVQEVNAQSAENQNANNQNATEKRLFCGTCGTQLQVGDVACYKCGAPTGAAPAEDAADTAEAAADAAPKKKSWFMRHIKAISIVTAIVLVLGGALYFAYPYLSNSIEKMTTTDEEYFINRITEKSETMSSDIASVYGFVRTGLIDGMKSESKVTLQKGEGLSMLMDDTGLSMVSEYVDWLDTIEISGGTSYDALRLGSKFNISVNGVELGEYDSVMDIENGEMYLGVPTYNDNYMTQRMGSAGIDNAEILEVVEMLPEEDVVENLINKYILRIAESVEKVEVTETTFKASGIEQDADKYTIEITPELVIKATLNVMEELGTDEEVKAIVDSFAAYLGEDADEFYEAIEEAKGNIEEFDVERYNDAFLVEFSIYVDGKGEIIGTSIEMEDAFEIVAGAAVDGSDVGIIYKMTADGTTVSLGGTGTGSITGSLDAELDLKVSMSRGSTPISLKLLTIKLDGVDAETGEGDYYISAPIADLLKMAGGYVPSDAQPFVDILSDVDLHICVESDFAGSVALRYKEEPALTISSSAEFTTDVDVDIPADTEDNPEDWASDFDFDGLYDSISEIGLPDMFMNYVDMAFDQIPY